MKVPDNPYLRFALFAFSEMFSFFVIAANFRALAQGLYLWTGLTDLMVVAQSMIVAKLMIEDARTRDWMAITAFSLGGATGSILSIWATKHLWGT